MKIISHFNDPNLTKTVIVSAILHLLFVSFIAITLKSGQGEFRSYFVSIVGPIEFPSAETTSPRSTGSGVIQERREIKPETGISPETGQMISMEMERLRTIEKLSALKRLREGVQIVEREVTAKPLEMAGYGVGKATESYYEIIRQKIWQEWVYPHLKTGGLDVTISIKIQRGGRITEAKIEKTSGDVLFDRSAMKAISKASPLPPPPMEMEIGVRFYL